MNADMLRILLFVCLVSGLSAYHSKGGDNNHRETPPLVQTAQGLIRGNFLTTYTGTRFYSFRGVRYAEPPTGENRFKPPVPVKPWQGEFDATKDAPICPQPFGESVAPVLSEDCLYLNVYSKKLTGKKPVIVFFHPGGFLTWTGRSTSFGPQYIMNKDIVLVTSNYRLGALGFLSTGDRLLRGNYGAKDQVAVLRWVKQNIAKFGGDPDNVSIMGYSAGAASVQMHMLSPMSKGLFHKAISMSGSATSGWAINRNPMSLAQKLTKLLGCGDTTTTQQVYQCLQTFDGPLIANRSNGISAWRGGSPAVLFVPVVEKDYGDGQERFLTDEPLELLKRGEINSVPLIIGSTADEMAHLPYALLSDSAAAQDFSDNFTYVAPIMFMYVRDGPYSKKVSQEFRKFYLNDQPISNATRQGLGELYTDGTITFSQVEATKLFAEKSSQPVYSYLYSYVGSYSYGSLFTPGITTPVGAVHHDDLKYILYISQLFPQHNATDAEASIINTLTTALTEFARTGVPKLPQQGVTWQPMLPGKPQFLEIGNDPEVDSLAGVSVKMVPGVPFPERMSLWESLFPLSGPHQLLY